MKTCNILIADDHDLVRDGLRAMFEKVNQVEIIGEAQNGNDAIEKVGSLKPDLVIMDINMPEKDGIQATREISDKYPDTMVLALTMNDDKKTILETLKAGADGYILKTSKKEELLEAIDTVMTGGHFFSRDVSSKVMETMVGSEGAEPSEGEDLTGREKEILVLTADGMTNEAIGEQLFISKRTVETHRRNLLKKTGMKNMAALVKYGIEKGIIQIR